LELATCKLVIVSNPGIDGIHTSSGKLPLNLRFEYH
jgi:hypothetical protein